MLTDRHIFSLTHSAQLKLQQGNWIGALNIYNDILQQRPDHKETYVELARLYLDREDVDSAREVLQGAVRIAPNDSDVHFVLGVVRYIEGDFENALESFRKVELKEGLDYNLSVNLALVHEVLGNSREALRYMKYAVSQGEPNWRSFEFIADLYKRLGKIDSAIKAAEIACKKFPEVAESHIMLGRFYQRAGNEIGALKHFELATLKAGDSPEILSEAAEFHTASRRYAQAVPILEKLVGLERGVGHFHTLLAKCYAELGQEEKAQKILRCGAVKPDGNASLNSKKHNSCEAEKECP